MTGPTREEVERLASRMEMSARVSSAAYDTCKAMDDAADTMRALTAENAALRERLEAAEARIGGLKAAHNTMAMETAAAKAALTEARAREAAAWEAGRDAAARECEPLPDEGWYQAWKRSAQTRIRALNPPTDATAAHHDDLSVDAFATAMKIKMAKGRSKGRGGWHDPEDCPTDFLAEMLIGHLSKGNAGNFEDIANIAMMLHQRGDDPACLGAALTAVKDAEWNAAIEAAAKKMDQAASAARDERPRSIAARQVMPEVIRLCDGLASAIRALRRKPKEGV